MHSIGQLERFQPKFDALQTKGKPKADGRAFRSSGHCEKESRQRFVSALITATADRRVMRKRKADIAAGPAVVVATLQVIG